jgi:hypothetical protein
VTVAAHQPVATFVDQLGEGGQVNGLYATKRG